MILHLHSNHKKKVFLSIFYLLLPSITLTSMEPVLIIPPLLPYLTQHTKYKPIELNNSETIMQNRVNLALLTDSLRSHHFTKISTYHIEKPGERLGACMDYALRSIFKITKDSSGLLQMPTGTHFLNDLNVLCNYFDQIQNPENDSLVVYTSKKGDYFPSKHYGIVVKTNPLKIRSKSGINRQVMDHILEYILQSYGNYAFFFSLKKKYQEDVEFLHSDLEKAIKNAMPCIQKEIMLNECYLQQIAHGNYILYENLYDFCINTIPNIEPYQKTMDILKRYVSVNINARTKNNETALMLASQRGDLNMVKILVQHYADATLKNNMGKTALTLAKENNHAEVTQFLTEQHNPQIT